MLEHTKSNFLSISVSDVRHLNVQRVAVATNLGREKTFSSIVRVEHATKLNTYRTRSGEQLQNLQMIALRSCRNKITASFAISLSLTCSTSETVPFDPDPV